MIGEDGICKDVSLGLRPLIGYCLLQNDGVRGVRKEGLAPTRYRNGVVAKSFSYYPRQLGRDSV
jgi:hypothetical protein